MTMTDTRIEELEAKGLALIAEARDIAAKAEAENRDFNADERTAVKAKIDGAAELKGQIDVLRGDKALGDAVDDFAGLFKSPGRADAAPDPTGTKSLGERFVTDPTFKAWYANIAPNGGMIGEKQQIGNGPPVTFRGMKDILAGGNDTGAGAFLTPDYRGVLDSTGTLLRPLRIRQLVTAGTTGTETVSYTRTTGFTNNAATVPEARGTSAGTASGDVAGTKPESSLEFEQVTENVKTVAHWMPATKRALSDAAQVRTLIDSFLRYGLEEELEDQITTGNGVGENFTGILHTDGHQTLDHSSPALTGALDGAGGSLAGVIALRVAKRLVRVNARAVPSAFVLNPADNERIDLTRDDIGNFYFGGPGIMGTETAWGLPRVESEAVPEGTAICADWRWAVLWDREQASIAVSDSHADFFVRNLVAILSELRAAFGILRPAAFVVIDIASVFGIHGST